VLCYLVIAVMVYRKSQKLFPIQIDWPKMIPVLIWLGVGWVFGISVQKFPEHFSWSLRLGFLFAYFTFPFLLRIIPIGKILRNRKPI